MHSAPDARGTFDVLPTEARNAAAVNLDLLPTDELVALMHAEDASVPHAVAASLGEVASAVDAISERMGRGGRLVYVGAGTSGRLGALDAAECESTFSVAPGLVAALVAGGVASSPLVQEAAEDDADAGTADVLALGVGPVDSVVGISASGTTPYVCGAIEAAKGLGALTTAIVSVSGSELGALVEHEIVLLVGPEVLAGSTRLKAGTAQKLVLNMLSTISMIRLGKTFGNLMVDVYASNEKLRARVHRIVEDATGEPPDRVDAALRAADGEPKTAIVSLLAGVDVEIARKRLAAADGIVRRALES